MGLVTLQSGGLLMDAQVGSRRCAYDASRLTGSFTPGDQTAELYLSGPAKLNSKLSSPGCTGTATMEGAATIIDQVFGLPYETYT